jgi:oligoendopeptidase F
VEEEILPLLVRLSDERREALGIPTLRPWDLSVDPDSHRPVRPYSTTLELEDGVGRILTRIDGSFGELYRRMRGECLDLTSIAGKPPGGEEFFRSRQGLPHILCNPTGSYDEVATLLHEFGHALHDYLSLQEQHLIWNLGGPDEFSELAAMAMMFLGDPYLVQDEGGPYTPGEARRARQEDIEFHLRQFGHIARMDAFQHWLYSERLDDVTADDLDDAWEHLSRRFNPGVDWSGLDHEWRVGWRQMGSFLFQYPFYYIEYGLSLLGAYGVWRNAMTDRRAALLAHVSALKLGNTLPLPELYRAAGAVLPFNREAVRNTIAFMEEMLRR